VDLDHLVVWNAAALVQAIDVLGDDDGHVAHLDQRCDRAMRWAGLRCQQRITDH
jgi:hypothetical protein